MGKLKRPVEAEEAAAAVPSACTAPLLDGKVPPLDRWDRRCLDVHPIFLE